MRVSQWFRAPRQLMVLFLGIVLALAGAQAWLSWRILEQDRDLENRRVQERLAQGEELIRTALLRRLSEAEEQLSGLLAGSAAVAPGDGALVVVFRAEGVALHLGDLLLYYPFLPAPEEPPPSQYAPGEDVEFQHRDYTRAAAVFRAQARSEDPAVRAGALARLGRNLRKMGQLEGALAAYQELAGLGATPVFGLPAELVARRQHCRLLEELKRGPELARETAALASDLVSGRWRLTRSAYSFYAQRHATPPEARAQAAGVEWLWEEWQRIRHREANPAGRRTFWVKERSLLLLWRSTPARMAALVAGPRYIEQQWVRALEPALQRQGVRLVALADEAGHTVLGAQQAARAPQPGLPWAFSVASSDPHAEFAQLLARRRLLLAGMAMMAALVLAGSYFIARAVTRELEVARLQSDFVAAVSHEFRSPLTSLRQLTELLARGRVSSDERREQYYGVLERETGRLHRLVESLLDFGRMEAGRRQYRFETVDAAELLRAVVAEFQEEVAARGYHLELTVNGGPHLVRADQEALGRAIWNLLDNAVKYSPECQTVWVEVDRAGEKLSIRVRDRGVGIPPTEQREIFKKFVRGSTSEVATVKGTGIGLAMVDHIVRAHRGEVRLESRPGSGSTFTVLLPAGE
jgi:signal transduction histidine kinase